MKKSKWIVSLILIFSLLLQVGTQIFADSQTGVVTNIKLTDKKGNAPLNPVEQWESFRINVDFSLPDGKVKKGDTTVIKLPEEITFMDGVTFPINDASGNQVANAIINQNDKTITLVYTDYPEKHSGVNGSLFFYVRVDHNVVDEKMTIPINISVENQLINAGSIEFLGVKKYEELFSKSGWRPSNDSPRLFSYRININQKPTDLVKTIVIDKFATPGISIDKNSFVIRKGTWEFKKGEWNLANERDVTADYNVVWDGDNGFSVDLGQISRDEGFTVNYNANSSYDLVDGEIITNNAKLAGDNLVEIDSANFDLRYLKAGGQAEGYVYAIQIHKQNEQGVALQGAKFDVIRKANGMKVGTIETDGSGNAKIEGLLKDTYKLVEIKAPDGYDILTDAVEVIPDDFNNKLAIKTIINKKSSVNITATKEWQNGPAQKPTIYFKLYREVEGGVKEEVPNTEIKPLVNGVTEVTWNDLEKADNGGKEYKYSVKEVDDQGNDSSPSNYLKNEQELKVTNTYESPKIELKSTKKWVGGPNLKPRIWFKLYRSIPNGAEQEVINVPVQELSNGMVTEVNWGMVDVTDINGNPYTYTVKEGKFENGLFTQEAPENYTKLEEGLNVTNTYVSSNIEVKATKEWVDGPTEKPTVYFKLYREVSGGVKEEVPNAEVKELVNGVTEATWTNQPKTDNEGNEYKYSVKEVAKDGSDFTPEHYEKSEDGLKVTNTYKIEKIEVVGRKVWENGPAVKPTIKLQLHRDGQPFGAEVELTNGVVEHTWSDLDKTDSTGKEYVYTVEEVETPENYEMSKADAFTVKNTFKASEIEVKATKEWVDGPTEKPTVYFKLYREIAGGVKEEVPNVEVKELVNGVTEAIWTNQPKTDNEGNEYKYSVKEVAKDGSDFTPEHYEKSEDGLKVTNTYKIEKIEVVGRKVWENGPAVKPTIKLQLHRDGQPFGAEVELTNGVVEHTWSDLDKTDNTGKEYVYTVEEVETPENYEMSKADAFTVKNTFKSPKISIPVEKVWFGGNVDKVTVNLKADGKVVKTFDLTEAMNWKYEIKDLDKLNSDGTEINYEIEEVKVSGYVSQVVKNDANDLTKGFTITNINNILPNPDEVINLKITKEWKGIDADKAPEIKVYLVRNGEVLKDKFVVLNKDNNWTSTFMNIEKMNYGGEIYEYSFKEANEVNGIITIDGVNYKVVYEDSKIINEKVDSPADTNTNIPKTAIGSNVDEMITLLVISGLALVVKVFKRKYN